MSEFMIDVNAAARAGREVADYERELNQIMQEINQSRRMLSGGLFASVRSHLCHTTAAVQRRGGQCRRCGQALIDISEVYKRTENNLVNGSSGKELSDNVLSDEILNKIDQIKNKIKRRIDEIINRLKDERTVEPYEVDSIVFDEEGTYGGDQGSAQMSSGEKRQQIYDIIRRNYPGIDLTDGQLTKYLEKMNDEGCGYVAVVNTIFAQYEGKEAEFEETFGYPMYDEKGDLNYDLLIADFYSSTDNRSASGGKINYNEDYTATKDGPREDYDYWNDITGAGSSQYDREDYLESFMKEHGVDVEVKTDAKVDIYNYQRLSEEGKQVIIAYRNGNLYNMDGTVRQQIIGGHAMVVTGVTEDGKLIVSSWGEQCYIDPYETQITHNGEAYKPSMTFSTVEYK